MAIPAADGEGGPLDVAIIEAGSELEEELWWTGGDPRRALALTDAPRPPVRRCKGSRDVVE